MGTLYIETVHIRKEVIDQSLCQFLCRDTEQIGVGDDLIVDIGEILNVLDIVSTIFQITSNSIENDIAHGVADVAVTVGGNPTDIHLNWVARFELFLLLCKRIMYSYHCYLLSIRATA